MSQTKSIRSRIIDLKPGGRILFIGEKERTIRNTASVIATLSGKRFSVRKGRESNTFMVYRYE